MVHSGAVAASLYARVQRRVPALATQMIETFLDEVPLYALLPREQLYGEVREICAFLDLPALAVIPIDDDVRASERLGVALIDHAPGSAALSAIERLAVALERSTVA